MGYGFAGGIGFFKETTFATAGTRDVFAEGISESVGLTIERFEPKNIINAYYEPDDVAGLRKCEGDIVFAANAQTLGVPLFGVLGVSSTTEVVSGYYTHDFFANTSDTSSQAPVPTYNVEIFRDVTSANLYMGTIFNKVSLQCQPNQDLRVTASIKAKTTSVVAKSTITYASSPVNPFDFSTASVSIAGAASTILEALTVELDNQVDGFPALNNTNEIVRYRRKGPLMIRLKGTFAFENLTEYNNFVGQTEQRMAFNFTSAASFALAMIFPRVVYTSFPVNMGGRDRITVGWEGTARYHTGSALALKLTLSNIKSGYQA